MLLNPFVGTSAVGTGGVSYFFEERFEGTGYGNSNSNGWTESGTGTIDEDYTGVVLEGFQSLRMLAVAQQPAVTATFASDQDELWVFFKFQLVTAMSNSRTIFVLRNSSATTVFGLSLATDNGWQVGAPTVGTVTVDKMSLATPYFVWGHYLKGTGADAVASVGFSASGTEPTVGNSFRSTSSGSAATDAHDIRLQSTANTTYEYVIDQILVSTTGTIGDSPA